MLGRERRGKRVVVWPCYIDETLSRSEGRKIAKSKAVKKPTVEEIRLAAQLLNLNPEVESSAYPRMWWDAKARVVVDKVASKRRILELIAAKIQELRGGKLSTR